MQLLPGCFITPRLVENGGKPRRKGTSEEVPEIKSDLRMGTNEDLKRVRNVFQKKKYQYVSHMSLPSGCQSDEEARYCLFL